ncbi:TPA: RES family NAD+ phosphorylase [Clostridium botulinum]|nr:RES family NAD+ phosphorylase [Clostridium botulinum]
MSNSLYICKDCFKSSYIKDVIENKYKSEEECCLCGKSGVNILNKADLLTIIMNIIRYNYSMSTYNEICRLPFFAPSRIGLKRILMMENEIFIKPLIEDDAIKLAAILNKNYVFNIPFDILGKVNDYLNILSYDKHMRYPLKNSEAVLITKIKVDLHKFNHYEIFDNYYKIFLRLKDKFPSILLIDKIFYRSRIGKNNKSITVDDFETEINFPYVKEEMRNAPPLKVAAGRFNRMGESMMYLASNEETALAESKPDVGHVCSVEEFVCKDEGKFLDMRKKSMCQIRIEDNLVFRNICDSISRMFNEPVTRDEQNKYLITEFLSDIFRKMGFVGIAYDSSLTNQYNIVSFYPKKIENYNKEHMVKINQVRYDYDLILDERKKYKNYSFDNEKYNKYEL